MTSPGQILHVRGGAPDGDDGNHDARQIWLLELLRVQELRGERLLLGRPGE